MYHDTSLRHRVGGAIKRAAYHYPKTTGTVFFTGVAATLLIVGGAVKVDVDVQTPTPELVFSPLQNFLDTIVNVIGFGACSLQELIYTIWPNEYLNNPINTTYSGAFVNGTFWNASVVNGTFQAVSQQPDLIRIVLTPTIARVPLINTLAYTVNTAATLAYKVGAATTLTFGAIASAFCCCRRRCVLALQEDIDIDAEQERQALLQQPSVPYTKIPTAIAHDARGSIQALAAPHLESHEEQDEEQNIYQTPSPTHSLNASLTTATAQSASGSVVRTTPKAAMAGLYSVNQPSSPSHPLVLNTPPRAQGRSVYSWGSPVPFPPGSPSNTLVLSSPQRPEKQRRSSLPLDQSSMRSPQHSLHNQSSVRSVHASLEENVKNSLETSDRSRQNSLFFPERMQPLENDMSHRTPHQTFDLSQRSEQLSLDS